MSNRSSLFLLAFVGIIGCTSRTRGFAVPAPESGVIDAPELTSTGASNVYDAILRLRPMFLTDRGSVSFINQPRQPVAVVVDKMWRGGIEELRVIDPRTVRSVRRLSAIEVYHLTGRLAPSGGVHILLGT